MRNACSSLSFAARSSLPPFSNWLALSSYERRWALSVKRLQSIRRIERQGTHTPLGGLTKKRFNARTRNFSRLDLVCRIYLCQHGLTQSVSGRAFIVTGRCSHKLTLIVVEAIVFLFCPGIYDSV